MRQSSPRITLLFWAIFTATLASSVQAAYYQPRASIWALAGTENQGQLDGLLPLTGNASNLFYADMQGKVGEEGAWYGGLGGGYRQLINDTGIYGGYIFVDRNESKQHNQYWVVSPGLEFLLPTGDLRLNGYFPLNKRHKLRTFFPSQQGDCHFIQFRGHQQFEHQFSLFENVGSGVDAEVGHTFPRLHNTKLYGGIYYFNIHPNTHSNNITGLEARIEVPVNPRWAVDLKSSYDNYQHGAVVVGLRFNLGGSTSHDDMHAHMMDAIPRNLGSLHMGSGIPIVESKRDNGLVLQRSNIYFITSQGGSTFVDPTQSGTFENPLSNDQFSQPVVNQIGSHANYYFNSGTYLIMESGKTPNAQINLPLGDSIYGRGAADFQCPATGNERPLLLGGIDLAQGNNTIDSIRLINSKIDSTGLGTHISAMNIQHVSNVVISNTDIQAIAGEAGNLASHANNFATGIYANNSQVSLLNSTISATALVEGSNSGFNFATGIGGNSGAGDTVNFCGNKFMLLHSSVNGSAVVKIVNNNVNFANGIGENAIGNGPANFNGNQFTLLSSSVSSTASVMEVNNNVNFATGIGENYIGTGPANFNGNQFTLLSSNVRGVASVTGINNNANFAAGIGENYIGTGSANFNGNTFRLFNSRVRGIAEVIGVNNNANLAVDIGKNSIGNNSAALVFTAEMVK
ncbi:hypothetical protein BH10PSE19_BH10PSE19_22610 [soil metagenome]